MPIPDHYRGASNYGRKYLYQLGFADGWDTDLFTAVSPMAGIPICSLRQNAIIPSYCETHTYLVQSSTYGG